MSKRKKNTILYIIFSLGMALVLTSCRFDGHQEPPSYDTYNSVFDK